jgi:hypothetical protein
VLTISAFTSLMVLGISAYRSTTVSATVGFQPVSTDELKMTSEPLAPGAPAIILYREVDRDDNGRTGHGGAVYIGTGMQVNADRFEDNYYRIKILTEEGRKYANVEIPLPGFVGIVTNIVARTIQPDGSKRSSRGEASSFRRRRSRSLTSKSAASSSTSTRSASTDPTFTHPIGSSAMSYSRGVPNSL